MNFDRFSVYSAAIDALWTAIRRVYCDVVHLKHEQLSETIPELSDAMTTVARARHSVEDEIAAAGERLTIKGREFPSAHEAVEWISRHVLTQCADDENEGAYVELEEIQARMRRQPFGNDTPLDGKTRQPHEFWTSMERSLRGERQKLALHRPDPMKKPPTETRPDDIPPSCWPVLEHLEKHESCPDEELVAQFGEDEVLHCFSLRLLQKSRALGGAPIIGFADGTTITSPPTLASRRFKLSLSGQRVLRQRRLESTSDSKPVAPTVDQPAAPTVDRAPFLVVQGRESGQATVVDHLGRSIRSKVGSMPWAILEVLAGFQLEGEIELQRIAETVDEVLAEHDAAASDYRPPTKNERLDVDQTLSNSQTRRRKTGRQPNLLSGQTDHLIIERIQSNLRKLPGCDKRFRRQWFHWDRKKGVVRVEFEL